MCHDCHRSNDDVHTDNDTQKTIAVLMVIMELMLAKPILLETMLKIKTVEWLKIVMMLVNRRQ